MKARYFGLCGALVLAALVSAVIVYPHLPDKVPTHWNIHNQVDQYGSPASIFLWPAIMAGALALFAVLPWLSPRHFEIETFESTYLYLLVVIMCELTYAYALVLWSALSGPINMNRAMMGGISLFLALVGNVMGKVRRNFYVGVRTPWTIANEQVWNATHRFAAKTFFAGGLAALAAVLLRAPFWLPMTFILIAALVPVVYSLVLYKQLQRRGQLT